MGKEAAEQFVSILRLRTDLVCLVSTRSVCGRARVAHGEQSILPRHSPDFAEDPAILNIWKVGKVGGNILKNTRPRRYY